MTAFLTPEEGLGSNARSLPLVHTSLRKAALDTPHLTVLCLLRAEIPRASGQLRPPVPSLSCLPRATFIYLSTALAHGLSVPHGLSPTESSQSKVLGRLLLCQRRQVVLECLYRWLDWLNLLPHLRQA